MSLGRHPGLRAKRGTDMTGEISRPFAYRANARSLQGAALGAFPLLIESLRTAPHLSPSGRGRSRRLRVRGSNTIQAVTPQLNPLPTGGSCRIVWQVFPLKCETPQYRCGFGGDESCSSNPVQRRSRQPVTAFARFDGNAMRRHCRALHLTRQSIIFEKKDGCVDHVHA